MQCGSNSVAGVPEGDIFAGRYRAEHLVGIYGLRTVITDHHIQLNEKVAFKLPCPHALYSNAVAQFAREARPAVKNKSAHVARASDVGTLRNSAARVPQA
jgi:serine/threonine-protein kinase